MLESPFFLYLTIFISYFFIHSLMASLFFKNWFARKFPEFNPYYRLLFNISSIILFIPLVALTFIYPGDILWQWLGWQAWLANLMAVIAIIAFLQSLADYDMREFFGVYPFITGIDKDKIVSEQFYLGRFHLYVRHPWYFFLLVLIWTRDMTTYQLLVAVMLTLYLIIGSWLEEKKMIVFFGDSYREYLKRVSGLVPLPWKYISRAEADRLLENLNPNSN